MAVVEEFTEIETGEGADALDRRPKLSSALAEATPLGVHRDGSRWDRGHDLRAP
jgi:hypothetical protein